VSLTLIVYLLYLTLSVLITVLVGKKLHRHGRPFLIDVFAGVEHTADAINQLLLVGFYLTNIAFVLFQMKTWNAAADWFDGLDILTYKLGVVLTTLGIMHFFNVFVLLQVRRAVHTTPLRKT